MDSVISSLDSCINLSFIFSNPTWLSVLLDCLQMHNLWDVCTLGTYAFKLALLIGVSQAGVLVSYFYKTDGMVLDAPHCLLLYSFRIYCYLLEDAEPQAFSSYTLSPRLCLCLFIL